MDPLSEVLALLKPEQYLARGFEVRGDWCIQFPAHGGIKCYAVLRGSCWLAVDGVPEAVRLGAGDCFLLPGGRPFRLASDLALPAVEVEVHKARKAERGSVMSGSNEVAMVGSYFALSGPQGRLLLDALPPIVYLEQASEQAALRWCIERMEQELREGLPGGSLLAEHLAHMMLLQALRLHLSRAGPGGVGWLSALADRKMSAAIGVMHADPAHRWTVGELAGRVGLSRSTFAERFKTTVGEAPLSYLTRWRMLLAADRLTTGGEPVSRIALSLGYDSEGAFSTAFKRVMGCAPRRYGREQEPQDRGGGHAAVRHVARSGA
ncbi:AraC family transcriptional regulator [Deinococcus planocerae]|uniref:AraC family transcriptional regulator n=1 Tax=Deinococcus planocerae TaxID=1737569 RepID=UPI000C7EFBE7|nr:AraC family transcriptional regulator [Deinococcus planocerae]